MTIAASVEHNGDFYAALKMQRDFFSPGAPRDITHTELKLWHCDATDHDWRSQYLHDIPDYLAGYFGQRYETLLKSGKQGRRRANTFLRNTIGKSVLPRLKLVNAAWQRDYAVGMPSPFKDNLDELASYDRDRIRDLAYNVASHLGEAFHSWAEMTAPDENPDEDDLKQRTAEGYVFLAQEAVKCGTTPPYWLAAAAIQQAQSHAGAGSGIAQIKQQLAEFGQKREAMLAEIAAGLGDLQGRSATAWVFTGQGNPATTLLQLVRDVPQPSAIYTAAMMLVGENLEGIRSMIHEYESNAGA